MSIILALLGLLIIFQGCTVRPTVKYERIEKFEQLTGDELGTFSLQASKIKIEQGKDNKGFVMTSTPTDYPNYKIAVYDSGQFGTETRTTFSKFENTDLVKEAGVEVQDHRIEWIERIGSIISAAADIVFSAGDLDPNKLPKIISTVALLDQAEETGAKRREKLDNIDAADGVKIDFGPIPNDAIDADKYAFSKDTSSLIYSACRDATIKFTYNKTKHKKTVRISDPKYFQSIAFPTKGKIRMHSECGASSTSEKETGVSDVFALGEALAKQGKAIKEAIEAAKKDEKSGDEKSGNEGKK